MAYQDYIKKYGLSSMIHIMDKDVKRIREDLKYKGSYEEYKKLYGE